MRQLDIVAMKDKVWRRIALSITFDRERADELVNDMYIEIYKSNVKLKPNHDNYIITILHNLNKKYYKDNKPKEDKTEPLSFDDGSYIIEIPKSDFDFELLIQSEEDSDVEIAKKQLFDNFFKLVEDYIEFNYKKDKTWYYKIQIFKLWKLEGLTQREIARRTNITLRSVHLATKKIRKIIYTKYKQEYYNYLIDIKNLN